MRNKNMIAGVIIITAILIAGCGGPKPMTPPDMLASLDLSSAQKQQLESLREQQMKNMKKTMEHIRKLHETLDNEFIKDTPDEAMIKTIIHEIDQDQQTLMSGHFQGLLAMRTVLTHDQFKKMIMMGQAFQKREHHKKRMFRPFPPRPKHMPEGGDNAPPPMFP